jgi:hypothetical protein
MEPKCYNLTADMLYFCLMTLKLDPNKPIEKYQNQESHELKRTSAMIIQSLISGNMMLHLWSLLAEKSPISCFTYFPFFF